MSVSPKYDCSLCERSYESEARLRDHEAGDHGGEMFRCLACTQEVAIFPSYSLASQHSRLVHEVTVEVAGQSSILLPTTLVKYSCKLCRVETKQFLTVEAIQRHLWDHSNSSFYSRNSAQFSEALCRVCEAGLEDTTRPTVSQHFESAHPVVNFASLADIPEERDRGKPDLGPSGAREDGEKKKEKVRARREREREKEKERTADLNHNKGKKVFSSERIHVLVNETSTDDEDDKLAASSAKRPRLVSPPPRAGERSPELWKYAGALVPLPYIDFPQAALLYSCTVCLAEADFSSLAEFEEHRESDRHRVQYGEKFRANNCRHFPDGAHYKGRLDLDCSYCPAKLRSRPSWLRHLTSHPAPERNPQGGRRDYCGDCRIPVLSYQHYERHATGLPRQLTKLCKFCDLKIFKNQMKIHSLVHKDQHFRCLLGSCARSPKYFMYKNVLMTHQEKEHGVRQLLNTGNCKFPTDLVRINCKLCSYHILFPDRGVMLDHLTSHRAHRYDSLQFLCRVCRWSGPTLQDVLEHTGKHRQPPRPPRPH